MSRVTCCWPSCPFPRYRTLYLCQSHANKVWRFVQDEADDDLRRTPPASTTLPDHERHGWVYYLDVGGRLKIGFAANLDERLRAYPPNVTVLGRKRGTMADEKAEHQRCTPWRVAGREWYELNDATRAVVGEAVQAEAERAERERNAPVDMVPRPSAEVWAKSPTRRGSTSS